MSGWTRLDHALWENKMLQEYTYNAYRYVHVKYKMYKLVQSADPALIFDLIQ